MRSELVRQFRFAEGNAVDRARRDRALTGAIGPREKEILTR